ncbi:Expansin-like A1-like protein [Drosera capensis]
MEMALLLLILPLLLSTAAACDRCVHVSTAAYFSNDSALNSGACGYGSLAFGFNGGYLAAAVPSLYKQALCSKDGTKVILTDHNYSNFTGFVLSSRAFQGMAITGFGRKLSGLGIVDVEYKRVPCDYKNKTLAVRVEEFSKKPNYLALKVLYQGGQTDITGIDVVKNKTLAVRVEEFSKKPNYLALKVLYQGGQTDITGIDVVKVGLSIGTSMSRNFGAVWDTSKAPPGPLLLKFKVTSGFNGKYVQASNPLPADWKPGFIYDTGVQISDIAQESCSPCNDKPWI